MRARWPAEPATAREYLARVRERGPTYDAADLETMERLGTTDAPPADKWSDA